MPLAVVPRGGGLRVGEMGAAAPATPAGRRRCWRRGNAASAFGGARAGWFSTASERKQGGRDSRRAVGWSRRGVARWDAAVSRGGTQEGLASATFTALAAPPAPAARRRPGTRPGPGVGSPPAHPRRRSASPRRGPRPSRPAAAAQGGLMALLHTWGQDLHYHPHLHVVASGGGLAGDANGTVSQPPRWVACRPGFFLPVRVLSRVFRGKYLALLQQAQAAQKLAWHGELAG